MSNSTLNFAMYIVVRNDSLNKINWMSNTGWKYIMIKRRKVASVILNCVSI